MSTIELDVDVHELALLSKAVRELVHHAKARAEYCDAMNAEALLEKIAAAARRTVAREQAVAAH